MNRENKFYPYEEVENILSLSESGLSKKEIAQQSGRTPGAINILLTTWDRYRKMGRSTTLSSSWKKHFDKYLSSHKQVAETIREGVLQEKAQEQPSTTPETERLLQLVEDNWKKTLESIAELVEYEASRRTKEETMSLQTELRDLREFKEKAQDSNIAGTLRKSLLSFK